MLKSRVITAVILLLLFLSALFALPDGGWAALVTVLVVQGALEWSRMARFNHKTANLFWGLTLVLMLGMIWFDASHTFEQRVLPHVSVYLVSFVLWLAIVPAWLMAGWKIEQPLLMALVGWAVLIPTGLAMIDLRQDHPWWLLGMMSLVWVADIAAYFTGRKFGKTKLAPSISPGKTWEGVVGAIVGVSICVTLAWSFSPYTEHFAFLPSVLIASWCWVGLAVIGDLFESAIKRHAGVKDSGALLPGHGGLLDRIDALTSTLPLAALAIMLRHLG
jgi:phosphatidate cytidylyltransferase